MITDLTVKTQYGQRWTAYSVNKVGADGAVRWFHKEL